MLKKITEKRVLKIVILIFFTKKGTSKEHFIFVPKKKRTKTSSFTKKGVLKIVILFFLQTRSTKNRFFIYYKKITEESTFNFVPKESTNMYISF